MNRRKSHRSSNRSISTEKVGVDFDLTFASNEGEVVQTMNQVAKNGVISELLVFPDSVSVDGESLTFFKDELRYLQARR